jgi:hypothetical protein
VLARFERVEVEDGHIGLVFGRGREAAAPCARKEEIQHRLGARRQGQKDYLQSGLQLGGFH